MKRTAFLAVIACLNLVATHAAEKPPLRQRNNEFAEKHRTAESIEAAFKELLAKEPDNPDTYILPANAYGAAASSVAVKKSDKPPGPDGFVLKDPKTGKQVGTLGPDTDSKLVLKGEALLAQAAEKFPERLDIHVGRMSLCEFADDVSALERAALDLIAHVQKQNGKLVWIDGAAIEAPLEEKVTDEIHARFRWLFAKEKPEADDAALRIAESALGLYPKSIRFLNIAAVCHAYKKEWQQARDIFLKASEVDPDDLIVLINVALASKNMNDTADAKSRFEAIIKKAPKSEQAQQAKEELKKLKAPAGKKR